MDIIAARNENEENIAALILEFESKIKAFFDYIKTTTDGERLVVKIKSHVSENEIYDDFGKMYRRYKILNRKKIGDYFFKETEDIVDKLCDDFGEYVFPKYGYSWESKILIHAQAHLPDDDVEVVRKLLNISRDKGLGIFSLSMAIEYFDRQEKLQHQIKRGLDYLTAFEFWRLKVLKKGEDGSEVLELTDLVDLVRENTSIADGVVELVQSSFDEYYVYWEV